MWVIIASARIREERKKERNKQTNKQTNKQRICIAFHGDSAGIFA
jgi:hypothetical protein